MVDLDDVLHHLPAVLSTLLGSYLAVRQHYKAHNKRLKAMEDHLKERDGYIAPDVTEQSLLGAAVGALRAGKGEDED